jgi:hypothetical protein
MGDGFRRLLWFVAHSISDGGTGTFCRMVNPARYNSWF